MGPRFGLNVRNYIGTNGFRIRERLLCVLLAMRALRSAVVQSRSLSGQGRFLAVRYKQVLVAMGFEARPVRWRQLMQLRQDKEFLSRKVLKLYRLELLPILKV